MIPNQHPPESHLLAFAAGQGDISQRLLVECHLASCRACLAQVLDLAEAGGRMLGAMPSAPVPADLFAKVIGQIEGEALPAPAGLPIPETISRLLPQKPDWSGILLRGFRFIKLVEEAPREAALYLVHLSAGTVFPSHRHRGLEESVILVGGLEDGSTRLEAGDWASSEAATCHAPQALADEDCWLVARMENGIRFTGWRGLAQRLSGL